MAAVASEAAVVEAAAVLVVPVAPYDIRVAVVVAASHCRQSAVIQGLLLLGMARETSAKLPWSLAGGAETRSRDISHQPRVGLRQDNPNTGILREAWAVFGF